MFKLKNIIKSPSLMIFCICALCSTASAANMNMVSSGTRSHMANLEAEVNQTKQANDRATAKVLKNQKNDNLKNILSALQATAKTNLETRPDQAKTLSVVKQTITLYNPLIATAIEETQKSLTSPSEPFSSASALCQLPNNNETCQKESKNAYTAYILPFFSKSSGTNNINPKIIDLKDLNFSSLFFSNAYFNIQNSQAQTNYDENAKNFLSQLASPYEFNHRWLTIKTYPGAADGDNTPATSPLISKTDLSFINNSKKMNQPEYQSALKAILLYESMYKSSLATRSIALSSLESMAQERKGGTASALAMQSSFVNAVTSEKWLNSMNKASPLTIQKAQLMLLSQIAKQQFQAHLDREMDTALLSAMLLKMNAASDSTALTNEKNTLHELLKKLS
jgi:hypothetical protein